jgi:HD-GYP domain-containing protein (c-di-GMP phosphodiesterase class II)
MRPGGGAVEVYDALTTSRPYQEKMPPEIAVERMRDLIGSMLDPAVHEALAGVIGQRQALVFLDDGRA